MSSVVSALQMSTSPVERFELKTNHPEQEQCWFTTANTVKSLFHLIISSVCSHKAAEVSGLSRAPIKHWSTHTVSQGSDVHLLGWILVWSITVFNNKNKMWAESWTAELLSWKKWVFLTWKWHEGTLIKILFKQAQICNSCDQQSNNSFPLVNRPVLTG